jgi:hypothetical protein
LLRFRLAQTAVELQLQRQVVDIRVRVRLHDAQWAFPAQPRRFGETLQILEQAIRLLPWRAIASQGAQPADCGKAKHV